MGFIITHSFQVLFEFSILGFSNLGRNNKRNFEKCVWIATQTTNDKE